MPLKKNKPRSFDQIVSELRSHQFDVKEAAGVANQLRVEKNGVAAVIARDDKGQPVLTGQPGVVLCGEVARLLDRGFQKFLKTSSMEVPATANRLRAVHQFTEELKLVLGSTSLYNESLGTVSDRYMYDRVKGRDLPVAKRPIPAWELPEKTR
jgi:hypothetical protein